MKINKTLTLKIEDATFTFQMPTRRDFEEKKISGIDGILSQLLSVEGLESDTGKIDADGLRAIGIDLPIEFVGQLGDAWGAKVSELLGIKQGAAEKKESTAN